MNIKEMFPELHGQQNFEKTMMVPYIRYHKSIGVDLDESILIHQFNKDLSKFYKAVEQGVIKGNYTKESFWMNYIDRNPISGMEEFVELIRSL